MCARSRSRHINEGDRATGCSTHKAVIDLVSVREKSHQIPRRVETDRDGALLTHAGSVKGSDRAARRKYEGMPKAACVDIDSRDIPRRINGGDDGPLISCRTRAADIDGREDRRALGIRRLEDR